MAKTPTSSADEGADPATAPSKKSAKKTQPEKTASEKLFLVDEMAALPNGDLVKIGLAAMVILHQRSNNFDGNDADQGA